MMAEVIILEIINDDDCFKFFSNTVDIYSGKKYFCFTFFQDKENNYQNITLQDLLRHTYSYVQPQTQQPQPSTSSVVFSSDNDDLFNNIQIPDVPITSPLTPLTECLCCNDPDCWAKILIYGNGNEVSDNCFSGINIQL